MSAQHKIIIFLSGILLVFGAYAGEVLFIATADLHGDIEAFARLSPVIRRYPGALKADAGDLIQGGYNAERYAGVPMFEALNSLGYDIFVPGNHEFEFAPEHFIRWSRIFNGRILGVQWDYGKYSPVRHTVLQSGIYRIGVIGLGELKLYERQKFYPGLHYREYLPALQSSIAALRPEKCDAIILICHVSPDGPGGRIFRILRQFPEISAVVCAHSHQELPGMVIADRMVIQPGAKGKSAALLKLHFSSDRRLQYVCGNLLYPGNGCDREIMAVKERTDKQLQAEKSVVSGNFTSTAQFGIQTVRLLRRAYNVDAAIMVLGRQDICGTLNREKLFQLLPYRNRVWIVKISLSDFKRLAGRMRKKKVYCFTDTAPGASGIIRAAVPDHVLWRAGEKLNISLEHIAGFERQRVIEELEKFR
ncbi:MAG: metallophosphoesterase [Lentisphaeria bacterium]|nr:metallophosphoesterase [Lentisphaeria bacterium]